MDGLDGRYWQTPVSKRERRSTVDESIYNIINYNRKSKVKKEPVGSSNKVNTNSLVQPITTTTTTTTTPATTTSTITTKKKKNKSDSLSKGKKSNILVSESNNDSTKSDDGKDNVNTIAIAPIQTTGGTETTTNTTTTTTTTTTTINILPDKAIVSPISKRKRRDIVHDPVVENTNPFAIRNPLPVISLDESFSNDRADPLNESVDSCSFYSLNSSFNDISAPGSQQDSSTLSRSNSLLVGILDMNINDSNQNNNNQNNNNNTQQQQQIEEELPNNENIEQNTKNEDKQDIKRVKSKKSLGLDSLDGNYWKLEEGKRRVVKPSSFVNQYHVAEKPKPILKPFNIETIKPKRIITIKQPNRLVQHQQQQQQPQQPESIVDKEKKKIAIKFFLSPKKDQKECFLTLYRNSPIKIKSSSSATTTTTSATTTTTTSTSTIKPLSTPKIKKKPILKKKAPIIRKPSTRSKPTVTEIVQEEEVIPPLPQLPPFDPYKGLMAFDGFEAVEGLIGGNIPKLYVGGECCLGNKEWLDSQNISSFVNVTKEIKHPTHIETNSFLRIGVSDSIEQRIISYFGEATDFINQSLSSNKPVLIHCKEGRSRSTTIAVAFGVKILKLSLQKSYEIVSKNIPRININSGFLHQLMEYERSLYGSNSINFFDIRKCTIKNNNNTLQSPPKSKPRTKTTTKIISSPVSTPTLPIPTTNQPEETIISPNNNTNNTNNISMISNHQETQIQQQLQQPQPLEQEIQVENNNSQFAHKNQ